MKLSDHNNFHIKVLIVDDEPPARRRIRSLPANFRDIKIVAECANGLEAIAAIENHAPDLIKGEKLTLSRTCQKNCRNF